MRNAHRRAVTVAGALATAACAAGALAWYGCSVYDPSLLLPAASAGDGGGADAAPEAGGGAPDAGADAASSGCPEAFPPTQPGADDPSSTPDQSFVVAVHTIDVGFSDAGLADLGYDLDHVYTGCDGGPESCSAAVTGASHPDSPGGRDNSTAQLLETIASFDPALNTSAVSQRIESGQYSVLLQVLHYNGQANDTQVSVGLYASPGVEGDAGAAWNGSDSWTVDQGFVVQADAQPLLPTHLDGNAYVAGGVLVMHINFPISLGLGQSSTLAIDLAAGVLTGNVVDAGQGAYRLTAGQLTGRWRVSDLLASLQSLYFNSAPLCPGTTAYGLFKQEACTYADIMTDPTRDRTGTTCDALSLGFGFTADPALLGAVVPTTPKANPCEAGVGAEPDTCTP